MRPRLLFNSFHQHGSRFASDQEFVQLAGVRALFIAGYDINLPDQHITIMHHRVTADDLVFDECILLRYVWLWYGAKHICAGNCEHTAAVKMDWTIVCTLWRIPQAQFNGKPRARCWDHLYIVFGCSAIHGAFANVTHHTIELLNTFSNWIAECRDRYIHTYIQQLNCWNLSRVPLSHVLSQNWE